MCLVFLKTYLRVMWEILVNSGINQLVSRMSEPSTVSHVRTSCILVVSHTVDGRNPAPVDVANIPLFEGFYTSQVVIAGFLNHQQYLHFSPGSLLCVNLQGDSHGGVRFCSASMVPAEV